MQAPPRSQNTVAAMVIVAAVAITGFAAVGIAWMFGWIGTHDAPPPAPGAIATPGQQIAGVVPEQSLLPGESVVTMPEPPKAAIPSPAPAQPKAAPIPPKPAPIPPKPAPRVAVQLPQEHSEVTRARIAPRDDRDICVNCGVVVSVASEPRGAYWDVIVRYDDGSTQTLRYPERQDFREGERVHLEDGRLLSDRRR
jgi:hypothetical protein